MFHAPHIPLHRARSADGDQRTFARVVTRTARDPQRMVLVQELYVDPVHGRHCICTRCAQRRAA